MLLRHMAARDICLWLHSLRTWGYSWSRNSENRGGEDVNKAIKYLFVEGNKRGSLVVHDYVEKRVANVKNGICRRDNRSSRLEIPKCRIIFIMLSFMEIPAYNQFT